MGYTEAVTQEARLSDTQRRLAARLAREKDLTCPDCGSSGPVPEGEVGKRPEGGADVAMRCPDCEGASEFAMVLSPEEAEALGLHSLGEDRGPT